MEKQKQGHLKSFPYIISAALVAVATVIGILLKKIVQPDIFTIFYLMIVVMSAVWWGAGPSILSTMLGVLSFDFFFVPPYFTLAVNDTRYIYIFAGFLVIGTIVSLVASRARKQALELAERETRTSVLYRLSRELAACETLNEVMLAVRKNVSELLKSSTAVFLAAPKGLEPASHDENFPVDDREFAVAHWVFLNKKQAGRGTHTLSAARALYVPLETSAGMLGVLGVYTDDAMEIAVTPEMELLGALASQASVALQRAKLAEASRQMELARQTEKLQTTLLNSISHDLRTPLVSITGALSTLVQEYSSLEKNTRKELLETAYEESLNMNRLVGNLLDMTRVEAGTLKINIKPCELRDVIGASLQNLKDRLDKRDVRINIAEDIFEIPMDFTLMMRVFINLVDNAAKYSAIDTIIEISAQKQNDFALISVKDQGFGIPMADLEHIFDKFYRAVKPKQVTGTGLGLSICRGIVEAHSGRIWAVNNNDKGATINIMLPMQKEVI